MFNSILIELLNNKPEDRHLALFIAMSRVGLTLNDYKYLIAGSSHIFNKDSIDVEDFLERMMMGN